MFQLRPRTSKPPFAIVEAPPVTPPAPPRTLGPAGQDLWARVQAEYLVADCGGIELLAQCCEAADRVQELAECIARDGNGRIRRSETNSPTAPSWSPRYGAWV